MLTLADLQNVRLLTGEVRGSAGEWVAARNQFTQYFRARTHPDNTLTTRRNQARRAYGIAVQEWHRSLTQAERNAWHAYAAAKARQERHHQVGTTGQHEYVRVNALRRRVFTSSLKTPPANLTNPTFTTPTHTVTTTGSPSPGTNTTVTWSAGSIDFGGINGRLLGFWSPRLRPTRRFWRSPVWLRFTIGPFTGQPLVAFESGIPAFTPIHRVIWWRLVTHDGRVSARIPAKNFEG